MSHSEVVESQKSGVKNKDSDENMKEEKASSNNVNTVPYYKLFSFADSIDYMLMLVGTIGATGNGTCMPLSTIILGNMINAFGNTNTNIQEVIHEVSKVAVKFLYLGLGAMVASFLQVCCWMVTGERQAARIRNLYLAAILRQEIGFFDVETNTGEIIGRISGDTILIQDAMGEKVGKFLQLAATFVTGFVVAFVKGWKLALVLASAIPLQFLSGVVMAMMMSRMASSGQTAYSQAANIVEQTIGSIRTVVSFTGEKQAVEAYNKSLTKPEKTGAREGLVTGLGFGLLSITIYCTYALAVWFGARMVLNDGYSGGDVVNINIALMTGSLSLGQASSCLGAFAAGQAAAFKMFEIINRKPKMDPYNTDGLTFEDIRGDIELKDIHFSYPARPDEQIFSGFSLSIPTGSTAALVGESGSGKSTVVSLIERFYDPQAGEVLIDGINVKDYQLKWIRQRIGLVSQEPVLFTCSIRDNVVYGKDGATTEEIRAALKLANAANFIDKLPQGLDTMVGENGTQLSGGQKQRIAIARAILKDPRILLLDEATSALDVESERIVQEALDGVMINRTTVIVAHRLSTVRNAAMIAVIHRGKIVETGSHSELIKNTDGAYSQLIRLQETSPVSETEVLNNLDRPEGFKDSGRRSAKSLSLSLSGSQRSIVRNNSHQSLPDTFAVLSGSRSSRSLSFIPSTSQGSIVRDISHHRSNSQHSLSDTFGIDALEIATTESCASKLKLSEQAPDVPLRRLAYLNKPEIPVLLLGVVAATAYGALLPIFGLLISEMIKIFFEPAHQLRKDSKFWALIFLGLGFLALLTRTSKQYLFAIASSKLIRRIRSMCFERVVHMEVGWFDESDHSSGAIGERLSADVAMMRGVVGDALGMLVSDIATALVALIIAFQACWQLAFMMVALLPLIVANEIAQAKFMKGFSLEAKKMYEEASQVANDAVRNIRTVASFCSEQKVMKLYQKSCEGPIKAASRQGLVTGTGFGLSFFLLYSVYAASFYAGSLLVRAGNTTFSHVFRVYFALTMASIGVSQTSTLGPDLSKAKSAVASVFAILDRKPNIDASDDSGMIIENVRGEIKFQHVSFKYPTRPDIQIFKDLCLAIHSGKTVALVGESGSGKSTVISLLQRFYDPDSGYITLDGIKIKKLQIKWLRLQMGLVSQEPILFNDTIRANIAYGKEGNATETEILAASELANAHKFISSLQQGYDTIVGNRGTQLSGGQKQRVAIARAIVKAPKILLLDEATSALDAESERVVQDALDKVMANRTTVIVAHRLSTIKNADVIAVVKDGVVAEKGRHDALINIKDGVYASLVSSLHTSASSS